MCIRGQVLFELLDAGVESDGALVGGQEVGLQRGPGDRGACVVGGGRGGFGGVDLLQQVAVAVEECPVDAGGAGDAGDADLVPVVECTACLLYTSPSPRDRTRS